MKFLVRNNVKSTLSRAVLPSHDTIYISKATSPFRNPPTPDSEHILRLTIKNAGDTTTKIEIVEVSAITEATAVEWRLDVERGKEGTTPFSFDIGDIIYLANTEESIQNKANISDVLIVERTRVDINGMEDPLGEYEKVTTMVNGNKVTILTSKQ